MKFLILVISFIFCFANLAYAECKFNCSEKKTKRENPKLIIKEGTIPLFKSHKLVPTKNNIILTDIKKNSYDFCNTRFHKQNKENISPFYNDINNKYQKFYTKNLQDNFNYNSLENHADFDTIPEFSDHLFNIHHDCLYGKRSACKGIIKLINNFQASNALTENKKNNANYNPAIFYDTVNRILKPLLLAYSTSSQVIGRPDTDSKIKEWALKAIFQNTYDPFETDSLVPNSSRSFREKDMVRENSRICRLNNSNEGCGSDPAQNHSLSSGFLAMMYGVLWLDEHMYQVGLDSYVKTLESVDTIGALPLEARRGGNGIHYSGKTISLLLGIYEIALNQNQSLEKEYLVTENLHKAVKFMLDVVEDESKIYPYSKKNWGSWKGTPSKQYISTASGFGWVRLYLLRFPNHLNKKRIYKLHKKLATAENIPQRKKELLNALVKRSFKNETFSKNFAYLRKSDRLDLHENTYSDDTNNSSLGSPLCLYKRDMGENESFLKSKYEGLYKRINNRFVLTGSSGFFTQLKPPRVKSIKKAKRKKIKVKLKLYGNMTSDQVGKHYISHQMRLFRKEDDSGKFFNEGILFYAESGDNYTVSLFIPHQIKIEKQCDFDDPFRFILKTSDIKEIKHQECVYNYFKNSGDKKAFTLYRSFMHSASALGIYLKSYERNY